MRIYRLRAFKYRPNYCALCAAKNTLQLKDLEVHHKDGNRKNNQIQNLLIVCRKCHQRLHGISEKPKINKKYQKETPKWKKK